MRFMNEPQAADYLNAKSDALRFADKEDSRGQGMKQFLDDKTYRPGYGAFKREKAKRASQERRRGFVRDRSERHCRDRGLGGGSSASSKTGLVPFWYGFAS